MSKSVICPDCNQRGGVRDGKINTHQKPGGGTCPGSGKSESSGREPRD
ncbi:hypothetical protein L1785_18630 [Antribacter sp. KLBMP9083]|uniref:Uncharacterized protein n=1 Tax=Antribacter soli TaxID=2910976 RepID=A0AA41QGE4_9MICO|nr:hypothetical protein [Antribacter soli]MCF4122995.1 hypothetical protein [Antribacter soli]